LLRTFVEGWDDRHPLDRRTPYRMIVQRLALPADDPAPLDSAEAFARWRRTAAASDGWYAGGKKGERPPGQIRRHEPQRVSRLQALWAEPIYRLIYDPDVQTRTDWPAKCAADASSDRQRSAVDAAISREWSEM
jgi:hypothetical protein